MKKILILIVVCFSVIEAYAERTVYFLRQIYAEPKGTIIEFISKDGIEIVEYEVIKPVLDPYSGRGVYANVKEYTAVLKADSKMFLLYSKYMSTGKLVNLENTIAFNMKERFFIGFISFYRGGMKVTPFPYYNAYFLQKIGDQYALFEIKEQVGADEFDVNTLKWIITLSEGKDQISSVSLTYKNERRLRSICYRWDKNMYLGLAYPNEESLNSSKIAMEILNMRSSPAIDSHKIGRLEKDEEVSLIGVSEDKHIIDGMNDYWYYVYSEKTNTFGWVFGGYLANH